jgi:WD40 repeat protein
VSFDGTVGLWDVAAREQVASLRHGDPVIEASWSPDGSRLATSTTTRNQIWDAEHASVVWSIPRPLPLAFAVHSTSFRFSTAGSTPGRFSPDGRRHLPPGDNRVLDAASGEPQVTLQGAADLLSGQTALAPDGARVLSRPTQGGPAHVWDAVTGERLYSLDGYVHRAVFSPDGASIAVGYNEGTIRVVSADSGREVWAIPAHRAPAYVRFGDTGQRLVSQSWDQTARVWDAATGDPLATLAGHEEVLLDASLSPDGQRVLTLALDHTARIWDLEGRELLRLSPGVTLHQGRWSPDGRTISIAAMDGTVRLYDTIPWAELAVIGDDGTPFEERVRRWREER